MPSGRRLAARSAIPTHIALSPRASKSLPQTANRAAAEPDRSFHQGTRCRTAAPSRETREVAVGEPLISSDSIKRGLQALSQERVEDNSARRSRRLRSDHRALPRRKAEHNEESLAALLEVAGSEVRTAVAPLVELGFLEQTGDSVKVPMLYREGLSITQGKAFGSTEADETTDDSQAEHPVPGTWSPRRRGSERGPNRRNLGAIEPG